MLIIVFCHYGMLECFHTETSKSAMFVAVDMGLDIKLSLRCGIYFETMIYVTVKYLFVFH